MSGDEYHFVSPDPTRPWPGVARDTVSRLRGLATLSNGSWRELESPAAAPERVRSLLTFPVAALSRAELIADWFDAAHRQTSLGGVVVAEEPGIEATCELEPLAVTARGVVLASVEVKGTMLDMRVIELHARHDADADEVHVSREIVAPVPTAKLHEAARQSGWEVLGQWSDWSGSPVDERWRIVSFRKLC